MKERTVGDVPAEKVDKGKGYECGHSCAEEHGHDYDEINIRRLLVDIEFIGSDLLVHVFLQNAALLFLEGSLTWCALIEKEENPNYYCIDDDEVDVNNRDVLIPHRVKIGVKGEVIDREEIFHICWDYCDERHIVTRLEAEDVGVDQ